MKKLLISIILLLTVTACFCQVDFDAPSEERKVLIMDSDVEPFLEQFVEDAKDRGFYVRSFLIQRIDSIYFHNGLTGTPTIGAVSMDMRTIYLNPDIRDNTLLLRTTIYHEIGHVIKKSGEHTCDSCYDIMSQNAPKDDSKYLDNEFWALKLDEYFEWLNGELPIG